MPSQIAGQIKTIVGANIKLARREHGLTQTQLSRLLDTDAQSISRWENAKVLPGPASLLSLSDALHRTPDWFYVDHSRFERRGS